jgi:hypothetical protein
MCSELSYISMWAVHVLVDRYYGSVCALKPCHLIGLKVGKWYVKANCNFLFLLMFVPEWPLWSWFRKRKNSSIVLLSMLSVFYNNFRIKCPVFMILCWKYVSGGYFTFLVSIISNIVVMLTLRLEQRWCCSLQDIYMIVDIQSSLK